MSLSSPDPRPAPGDTNPVNDQMMTAASGASLAQTDLIVSVGTDLILIYASRGPARRPEGAGESRPAGLALPPPRAPLRADEAAGWR